MLEIRFHGRGGHGVKTAAIMLAEAFLKQDKHVQAFPEFGPERRGAPVKSFVRVDDKKITTHESVTNPNIVVVLDDSLDYTEFIEGLDNEDILIINSKNSADHYKFDTNIYTIDATDIALDILGANIVNTIMLSAAIAVAKLDVFDELKDLIYNHFKHKKGEAVAEKNVKAMEVAYEKMKR